MKRTSKRITRRPVATPAGDSKRRAQPAATFLEHVIELRRRLFWVAAFFVAGSSLAYAYRAPLIDLVMAPLDGQKLVYLTPGGGFAFIFNISIYAGLIAAAPVLLYHLHAFIKPALPARAQRSATKVILAALGLILAGISYGYFVAVPAALHFLMDFAGDAVTPNLTADSYLSFFLAYTGGLALLSLLPLFLMFWHWIKPLTPSGLFKSERWVIVFAFVAAAIITPTPDVMNQLMIAGPVIGLYQLGVVAILLSGSKQPRQQTQSTESVVAQPVARPATVRPQPTAPVTAVRITHQPPAPQSVSIRPIEQQQRAISPARRRLIRTIDGIIAYEQRPQLATPRNRPPVAARPYQPRLSIDGMLAR